MNQHHSLEGIVPMARPAFAALLQQAEDWGFSPVIGDALRTCADQAAAGKVERSWHVFGRAVDLQLSGADAYRRLGEWWESVGGTWGGRWTSAYPPDGDFQHYQWSGGRDGIPAEIWPDGEDCDAARAAYLASSDAQTPLAASLSSSRRPRRWLSASVLGGALGALGGVLLHSLLRARGY